MLALRLLLATFPALYVHSQASNSSATNSASVTQVVTTLPNVRTINSSAGHVGTTFTAFIPTTLIFTLPTPTPPLAPTSATAAPAPTSTFIHLDTTVSAPYGVLGAILVLTGLPSAFWGHKNRWTSFFLIGFYTLSLVCLALILRFGVLPSINPPSVKLQGLFVLSCTVAGFVGGGVSIFFWQQTKYFMGAWGGFALALWIQCFRSGGVIRTIGLRWLFYIAVAVVGFVSCTIPRIHYHVLLVSTAVVGASAFILGVDCFTTAGLKEFYVSNLGFQSLFPKFTSAGMPFPLSQTMEIELGLIAAVALMGGAVQLRILVVLRRKLGEIAEEQRKRDLEENERSRARYIETTGREREVWEEKYGSPGTRDGSKGGETPLMGDVESAREATPTPLDLDGRPSSQFSMLGGGKRARFQSTTSADLGLTSRATPTGGEENRPQTPGLLPALELGGAIQEQVPNSYISDEDADIDGGEDARRSPELKERFGLLAEIRNIRKSIQELVSRPAPELPTTSSTRHMSLPTPATSPSPPSATKQTEWEYYLASRKLFTPPAGPTAPIPTSPSPAVLNSLSVAEAVSRRQRRESLFELGATADESFGQVDDKRRSVMSFGGDGGMRRSVLSFGEGEGSRRRRGSEDIDERRRSTKSIGALEQRGIEADMEARRMGAMSMGSREGMHTRTKSANSLSAPRPLNILPPVRNPSSPSPTPVRTITYEELDSRHRQKLRELQDPLTQKEREQAKIDGARDRWTRSLQIEKKVMKAREEERKKAEKEKEKQKKEGKKKEKEEEREDPSPLEMSNRDRRRSSSSTRLDRVQDWQKYQQVNPAESPRHSRSGTGAPGSSGVPFPRGVHESGATSQQDARRVSRMSGAKSPLGFYRAGEPPN